MQDLEAAGLRDAIAHGRAWASTLIERRYKRPKGGRDEL
jgi:hypothetical protein